MYDQSFNKATISRAINLSDFIRYPHLLDSENKGKLIEEVIQSASKGFQNLNTLETNKLKGKSCYRFSSLADELLIRMVSANIKKVYKAYQKNRNEIISTLVKCLQWNVDIQIFRLDLKTFYESLDVASVVKEIKNNVAVSRPSAMIIETFFSHLKESNIFGLPRGIGLSAVISEIAMQEFDMMVRGMDGVFYYNRFVDDIILLTDIRMHKSLIDIIAEKLPHGVEFHDGEKKLIQKIGYEKAKDGKEGSLRCVFDYLGYEITIKNPISSNLKSREVVVDISHKKIKKIKTRCVKSLIDFIKDNDFNLLNDRIKFLTSNYPIYDVNRGIRRLSGIYYNYRFVDIEKSNSIADLDKFLRHLVLGVNTKVSKSFNLITTKRQRRLLLKNTFKNGFCNKHIHSYSQNSMKNITKCWAYE